MRILKCNFEVALYAAIERLKETETKAHGKNFKSSLRIGLEEALEASQNGEQITIEEFKLDISPASK